ncbi:MAG: hemolysin family protein [Gemmatimonadetes bacterium]|nr:hemolysin family protein [Gemmatimonadota bacterium]
MEPSLSGLDIAFRLLAVLLLVAANGFFVASEFALVTVRRTRIDELVAEGKPLARAVRRAIDDIDAYIAATQLGITMASIGLGWIGEPALAALIEPAVRSVPLIERLPDWLPIATAHGFAVLIAFAIITGLHIVLGELAPKTVAIQKAERTSLAIALPMEWFYKIFRPFVTVLNGAGMMVLRAFGFSPVAAGHHVAHSEEELRMIVSASTQAGVLEPAEEDMIHRVFEFADLTANQVMVPRTEVVGLPVGADREVIEETLRAHGFTRYPVFDGTLDNIVGIVNVKDILPMLQNGRDRIDLRRVMQTPVVLPESVRVLRLLAAMQANRRHMVVLIDEFGGTAGIVTLRDVLERIVGDVRSDKETAWPDVEEVGEREALVDGLLLIGDVNEHFGLELDEEEYTTIGGYAFGQLGRRPEIGDVIETTGCRMVVEGLDGMRVSRLRLYLEEPAPQAAPAEEP